MSRRVWFSIGGVAVVIAIGTVLLFSKTSPNPPLPVTLLARIQYKVYFPDPLPSGYSLDNRSVSYQNGVLFYALKNAETSNNINVSQQQKPQQNLMLSSIVGLNPFKVSLGTAYVGAQSNTQVGILVTDTTLVNVSGVSDTPASAISGLMKNLKPVPRS